MVERQYPDMWDHVETLREHDKLVQVDREINKDTELHPLVRWQYRGGLDRAERKAFLFTNVVDSQGRTFDIPVTVAALGGSPEIYGLGLGVDAADSKAAWEAALDNAYEPVEVSSEEAPIHEVVFVGDEMSEPGQGLDGIPAPISTPGWDNAPYTTASYVISHHPETGVRNVGNYRAQFKTRTRTGMNPSIEQGQGITEHWNVAKERGEPLPIAICVGAPPAVAYSSIQKFGYDVDELAAAGGLVDAPIREVEGQTQPVLVPADADIVIEGEMRTDVLEPEAPFGESHGYINPKEYNMVVDVTAITRREDALYTSFISQVTPSESSGLKVAPWEALFRRHLREQCNVTAVKDVALHEPLTSLRKVTILQMAADAKPSEVWRAMYAAVSFRPGYSKFTVAVDEDIDPHNPDAVFWAMGYRSRPQEDVQVLEGMDVGHAPRHDVRGEANDAAVLWDATLKTSKPPISLPKKEYMERARELWKELELPDLEPEMPWYGYSLGEWNERLELEARRAVESRYFETGKELEAQRVSADEVEPNTSVYGEDEFPDDLAFEGLHDAE